MRSLKGVSVNGQTYYTNVEKILPETDRYIVDYVYGVIPNTSYLFFTWSSVDKHEAVNESSD